jgi:homoserine kinase
MIEIKVPATTANMGPGFDCLGLALDLYNIFYIEEIKDGLIIEGCDPEFQNKNNLVYTSMLKCFKKLDYSFTGVKIIIENNIPVSRGLGSSASCILAGIIGANEIAGGSLSIDEIFQLASEIEGHPDNISPALFGGMTVSISNNNTALYNKIPIAKGLKFCALVPDFKLSTEKARAVLPNEIPYKDAVFNVGRASFMVSCLVNGKFDLLNIACKDKLHQNYRGKLINDYNQLISKCENLNCFGVFLSGAGPTIMVILEENNDSFTNRIKEFVNDLNNHWNILELNLNHKGTTYKKGDVHG